MALDDADHPRLADPAVPARRNDRARARLPAVARAHRGLARDARDRGLVRVQRGRVLQPAQPLARAPAGRLLAVGLRRHGRRRCQGLDPRRSAVDLHGPGRVGRLDADPPVLDHLRDQRSRIQSVLRLPELLRLLDAAAGPGRELLPAHHRLGLRRRGVLPVDLVLLPAHHGHTRGPQGVRDQRARRRRAGARHLLHLHPHRHGRLPRHVPRHPSRVPPGQHRSRGRIPAPARGGVRQVRPGAAAHLAARRHGGPDPGLGSDPRRDHGHRRRVPDRPHASAVRARPHRRRRGGSCGRADARPGRDGGPRPGRHQAGDRLFDHVADRLHDHGRLDRRLLGRPVPSDDPRLLQGAPVHGRGLDHRRHGGRAVAGPNGRLPPGAALHLRLLPGRRVGPVRVAAVLGLVLQGRDPRLPGRARRRLRHPPDLRLRGRAADRRRTRSG